jgi:hypothetical protein
MARGSVAKENVAKILSEAFGQNWIGEYDKKYYVWANDGGERVQIAISLTCPKTFIEVDTAASVSASGDWDFSDTPKPSGPIAVANAAPAEITEEEKENIAALMARLGL